MQRYIALYKTDGSIADRVRTELADPDAKLKARMFMKLAPAKRENLDLRGIDFTGMKVEGARNCWFDDCKLIGAALHNISGSSFRGANLTGASFTGRSDNLFLEKAILTGINVDHTDGIIVGGYFTDGSALIVNKRVASWWVRVDRKTMPPALSSATPKLEQLYFSFTELSAIAYTIADDAFVNRLIEMVGPLKEKMRKYTQDVTAGVAADLDDMNFNSAAMEEELARVRQNQSRGTVEGIPMLTESNSGDVLNQHVN